MAGSLVTASLIGVQMRLGVISLAVIPLMMIPPLAPVVMCHLLAAASFAVAKRRSDTENDELLPILVRSGHRWLRMGNVAVAMGVVLSYYYFLAFDGRGFSMNVAVMDPMRFISDAFSPLVKGCFLALALWYGARLTRTLRLLAQASAPDPEPTEIPASDVVY
ncbi:MAG: hypothetical protein CMJ18_00980 [Phycisphaeraceae bacterium]|nr:hypothetical protein [Phycisphaeraceae bacterium]